MADFWDTITAPFSTKSVERGAEVQQLAALEGQRQASAAAGAGRSAVTGEYTAALEPYMAMQPTAMGGYQAYADASGANGPEGLARANAQYLQGTPGFAGATQQAADAIARAGVTGGATGNTIAGITDRVTQMGLDAYGNYVSRLAPWLGQATNIAGGMSGIHTGLGAQLGASYGDEGRYAMSTYGTIGEAKRRAEEAPIAAGNNLWNAGLGLANVAANVAGGAGTGAAVGAAGNLLKRFTSPTHAGLSGNPYEGPPNPLLA